MVGYDVWSLDLDGLKTHNDYPLWWDGDELKDWEGNYRLRLYPYGSGAHIDVANRLKGLHTENPDYTKHQIICADRLMRFDVFTKDGDIVAALGVEDVDEDDIEPQGHLDEPPR